MQRMRLQEKLIWLRRGHWIIGSRKDTAFLARSGPIASCSVRFTMRNGACNLRRWNCAAARCSRPRGSSYPTANLFAISPAYRKSSPGPLCPSSTPKSNSGDKRRRFRIARYQFVRIVRQIAALPKSSAVFCIHENATSFFSFILVGRFAPSTAQPLLYAFANM